MSRDEEKNTIQITQVDHSEHAEVKVDIQPLARAYPEAFLLWLHSGVLKNNSTLFKKIFGAFGYAIGAASTYSGLPLGTNFVITLTKGSNSIAAQAFQKFGGIVSFGPTAVLLGRVTKAEFDRLYDYLAKKPRRISNQDHNRKKQTSMGFAHFFASFTGVPFYVLLQPYFVGIPVIDILMPWTGMVSSYCACIGTERDLLERYFIRTHREDAAIAKMRKELVERIQSATVVLRKKNTVEALSARLSNRLATGGPKLVALNGLKLLLAECKPERIEDPVVAVESMRVTRAKRALDIFALVMGAGAAYVLYQPAQQTGELSVEYVGIDDQTSQMTLDNLIAVMAVLANAIFDAMFAKYDTDRIYQAWCDGQRMPGIQAIVAMLIAICSCFPMAYLAVIQAQTFLESLFAIPVFIGGALARDLAFYELISFVMLLISHNSPNLQRQSLIEMLEQTGRGVEVLPAGQLTLLNDALSEESALVSHSEARHQRVPSISTSSRMRLFSPFVPDSAPVNQNDGVMGDGMVLTRRRHSCP